MAHDHLVNISIDKHKYDSPNPTTGQALYVLGGIAAGYDLFKETHGSGDDSLVPKTAAAFELHNGDKFYSAQSTLNPGNGR